MRPWHDIGKSRNDAVRPRYEGGQEEIRFSAKRREGLGRKGGGDSLQLADIAAGEFDADDAGMRLRQTDYGVGTDVDATSNTGEVVDQERQGRVFGYLIVLYNQLTNVQKSAFISCVPR